MSKIFKSDADRAVAYAAFKELERCLKEDGELPPGFSLDVSNRQLILTIPNGTTVNRSPGVDGDGHHFKKASQNLNGFAMLHAFLHHLTRILSLFNQRAKAEEKALRMVKRIVNKALRSEVSSEEAFKKLYPNIAKEIASLKEEIRETLPERQEDTPRLIDRENKKLLPTLSFPSSKKQAA